MDNEEYLDKLGTAKYLLRDQPVDENTAEFYPPESDEHPKCVELRYFAKGRLNLEFVGIITAKSLVSKYAHTYAWFEMGSSGLRDIVSLWGDNNEDDYPQIKKIIGPGIGTFMVLVEWCRAVWDSVETGKDEEMSNEKYKLVEVFGDLMARDMFGYRKANSERCAINRLSRWMNEHHIEDESLLGVELSTFNQIKDILDIDNPINTHIKPYSLAEIGRCSDGHYLMLLDGGNNGEAHWHSYLEQIQAFLFKLHNAGYDTWIVEIKNDCPDDTHQIILGVEKAKTNQIYEFSVDTDVQQIDVVCTYVYGWCGRECSASDHYITYYDSARGFRVQLIYAPGEWHYQSTLDTEFDKLKADLDQIFGDTVRLSKLVEFRYDIPTGKDER